MEPADVERDLDIDVAVRGEMATTLEPTHS